MIKDDIFLKDIEILKKEKEINYIDAIVEWCKDNNIEIDIIAEYIKKDNMLRSKIQFEAENLNYLKKGNRLPI